MNMSSNISNYIDFVFQRYPTTLTKHSYNTIEYLLPRISKKKGRSKYFLKFLKTPYNEYSTIKFYEQFFINLNMNDFNSFDRLYEILIKEFQSSEFDPTYLAPKKYHLCHCFTFCFNFIKVFHQLHENIPLIAVITFNPRRHYDVYEIDHYSYPQYATIFFLLHQYFFDWNTFSHTHLERPEGYFWRFDTDDIPLLEWMIETAKTKRKLQKAIKRNCKG